MSVFRGIDVPLDLETNVSFGVSALGPKSNSAAQSVPKTGLGLVLKLCLAKFNNDFGYKVLSAPGMGRCWVVVVVVVCMNSVCSAVGDWLERFGGLILE